MAVVIICTLCIHSFSSFFFSALAKASSISALSVSLSSCTNKSKSLDGMDSPVLYDP